MKNEKKANLHVKRAQQLLGFGVGGVPTHWLTRVPKQDGVPQQIPLSIVHRIKKATQEDARTVEDRLRMCLAVKNVDSQTRRTLSEHESEHISVLKDALECKQRIKQEWMNVVLKNGPTTEENQIIEWFKKVAPFDCEILGYAWHDLRKRHGFMDEMLQTGQVLNAYVTVLDELKEILWKDKSVNRNGNIAKAIIYHLDHESFFRLRLEQLMVGSQVSMQNLLVLMVELEQRRRRSEIFIHHNKNQHEKYAAMFPQFGFRIRYSKDNTDIINSIDDNYDIERLLNNRDDFSADKYVELVFDYTIFKTLSEQPHKTKYHETRPSRQTIIVLCDHVDENEIGYKEVWSFQDYLLDWVEAIFPEYTVSVG